MEAGLIAARLMAFAIDGVDPGLDKNAEIDHEELMAFARSHSIANVICVALEKLNMMPPQYASEYSRLYKTGLMREATQEIETQDISEELCSRGIKHMLLKGSVMKYLYPSPDLRSMCDVDILYDTAYRNELEEIMTERGYTLADASGTDKVNLSYIKKPFMNIEFHGVLMDKDIPLYNSYFGNNFEHTVADGDFKAKYSDEDFFVFMAAHLAKHYFNGGTGIRSLADIWLYLCKKPELDTDAVRAKLKEIELDEFIDIIIGVNGVLFEGKEPTDLQSEVIDYIFHSGTYGTQAHKTVENMDDSGKVEFLVRRLFPNKEFMAINYPLVGKCVLLLPFFWIIRLFRVLLKKEYKHSDVSTVMKLDSSQIDARKIPGKPEVDYNYNNAERKEESDI